MWSRRMRVSSLAALAVLTLAVVVSWGTTTTIATTAQTLAAHGYPAEEHVVRTHDGYMLTMYRIPSSPAEYQHGRNGNPKAVVFLQHGLLCTSDIWIINGPNASLPYMLADAGYDVWLGNARGNSYSRRHHNIAADSREFWNFSWHEIGVHDLATMFDYILTATHQTSVHFVGHSQGTTAYFALMSTRPEYNDKVKSVHLLAPVAFMSDHTHPLLRLGGLFFQYPTVYNWIVGSMELPFVTALHRPLRAYLCSTRLNFLFYGIIKLLGWGTRYFNQRLLPHVCSTHPSGASTSQLLHYLQLYKAGDFRHYDYGATLNRKYYKQDTPPAYNMTNISSCVNLYYSQDDQFAIVKNVKYLAETLPCAELYQVPYDDWSHADFIWSINLKEAINDGIVVSILKHDHR